ncbi:glycosyltransferase family 9 protein [Inquilinus sp. KBS0705]|nr:glycosyltransferase family 9 protein [Inquilinus sp. KBS0705]
MKPIMYRFYPGVSQNKIRLIKAADRVLNLFNAPVKAVAIKSVTIVQLAHIGDLLLILPAVKKLKLISNLKVNLVVNRQNYHIASKLNFVDEVIVADAPWFARGTKAGYYNFIKQLGGIKTDLIFDVRGDFRNNIFIKLFTKSKVFAGYNVGGGGGLLNKVLPYQFGGHASGFLDPLFDYLELPDIGFETCWNIDDVPFEPVTNISFPAKFVVVHLGAGAQSRRWPVENFIEVIKAVANSTPVLVLGTDSDATPEQLALISAIPNVVNCVGKYSLLQAIYIVKRCSLFVGLESGFSHIAAMLKRKIICLFSGTSNINVWQPHSFFKGQVVTISQQVPCNMITGCGKSVCDDNICMKQISPLKVANLINQRLNDERPVDVDW